MAMFMNPNPSFASKDDDDYINQHRCSALKIVFIPVAKSQLLALHRHNDKPTTDIPIEHDSATTWDWPLQHTDGVVKVNNTDDKFEVSLDVQFFGPQEIDVKVADHDVFIHCLHEPRKNEDGAVCREIHRCYRLPSDVEPNTLRSQLFTNGIMVLSAKKKKNGGH